MDRRPSSDGRIARRLSAVVAIALLAGCGGSGSDNGEDAVGDSAIDPGDGESVSTGGGDNEAVDVAPLPDGALPVAIFEFDGAQFVGRGYLALADGTLTDDFDGVRTLGVEGSRAANADRWADWRESPNEFALLRRKASESGFTEVSAEFPIPGAVPDGCYSSTTGLVLPGGPGLGSGSAALTIDTLCFNASGFYSTDRSSGLITDTSAGGADQGSAGRYAIDGYSLTLSANDGSERVTVLGIYNEADTIVPSLTVDGLYLSDTR